MCYPYTANGSRFTTCFFLSLSRFFFISAVALKGSVENDDGRMPHRAQANYRPVKVSLRPLFLYLNARTSVDRNYSNPAHTGICGKA